MEYLSVKELSAKHNIAQKTVYNYINKYPEKIRSRKEFWKTIASAEDFTNILQQKNKIYNSDSKNSKEKQLQSIDWNQIEWLSKLQKNYNLIVSQNKNLKKRNDVLERQIVEYGGLYVDEKAEKKEILKRMENLQNDFKIKIENHSAEKIKMMTRYYALLVLCVICLLILITFVIPNILGRLFPNT